MSELSKLNELVSTTVEEQTPAPAAAAGATPAVGTDADEVTRLRAEIDQLKAERTVEQQAARAERDELRLKAAVEQAHRPSPRAGTSRQDTEYAQLIRKLGGLAFLTKLPPAQRCELMHIYGSEQVPDKQVTHFFGPKSNSEAASQLHETDSATYMRLRGIALCRGIIG